MRNGVRVFVSVLTIWFGLWLTVGDRFWWLTLLNRVVPYLFLPLPFLIALTLYRRQYRLLSLLSLPTLIFSYLYWPYLLPRLVSTTASPQLKVMTYNVLYGNRDAEAIAELILADQPDLVALLEVRPRLMAQLRDRLAATYPYALLGNRHPYGTTAVFSRHPFREAYVLDLTVDRPAVVVKTTVEGQPVTFISAHLQAYSLQWVPWLDLPEAVQVRTRQQNDQARQILETVQEEGSIVILACDCNSPETSSTYRLLSRTMTNAARQIGWRLGSSPPAAMRPDLGWQHIDYLFYRGPLQPLGVFVGRDRGGSDHAPVSGHFAF